MAGLIQTAQSGSGIINPIEPITDGELKLDSTGAYYTPKGGMTVEDRMTGLLAKDNPYMKVARTGAAQTANSRGLLNSSIAASAGEEAAIKSALPIAQQDAAYYQNLGQQKNQGAITSILNKEQGATESKLQAEQGEIQKGLYQTQGDITKQINDKLYQHQTTLAQMGYDHATVIKNIETEWNKIELASIESRAAAQLEGANKEMFNNSVNKISDDFMNDYLEITINPNFETSADRQKALDLLRENAQANYQITADIAGYELSWTPPTPTAPAGGSSATTTSVPAGLSAEEMSQLSPEVLLNVYGIRQP